MAIDAFVKIRCGVATIRLETGGYENIKLDERLCLNCSNLIDEETHVVLHCPVYSDIKSNLFTEVLKLIELLSLSDCQSMVFLFSN